MNIRKPTLLLDETKVQANIEFMIQKSRRLGVQLAPHFKTHQSRKIGGWYKEAGITEATVSSVTMAKYFAPDWKKITIVFPINILEIEEIDSLAGSISLTILVNSIEAVDAISKINNPVSCYIEIDTGYHRTGIQSGELSKIEEIIDSIQQCHHEFRGFYLHSGNTYSCHSSECIKEIHDHAITELAKLKNNFSKFNPEISLGDTPSCSTQENFQGIDTIRPGNFVFYDLTQQSIGSCGEHQIAISLAAPVVYKSSERHEVVVYAGGVHLSKDRLETSDGTIYGKMIWIENDKWSDSIDGCFVKSISQEHGTLKVTEAIFNKIKIGDVIGILPVHSCMLADSIGGYQTFKGELVDHASGLKFE